MGYALKKNKDKSRQTGHWQADARSGSGLYSGAPSTVPGTQSRPASREGAAQKEDAADPAYTSQHWLHRDTQVYFIRAHTCRVPSALKILCILSHRILPRRTRRL